MKLDLMALWPFLLVAICFSVVVLRVSLNESSRRYFPWAPWVPQLATFSLRQSMCLKWSVGFRANIFRGRLGCLSWSVGFRADIFRGYIPWIAASLMLAVMPPLSAWLELDRQRQIGTYGAWSHYYGYLHLFRGENANRKRLENHIKENPVLKGKLYSDAVVTLWPKDDNNPPSLKDLNGIEPRMLEGGKEDELEFFEHKVGGNTRKYGNFKICKVYSSKENEDKEFFVVVDKVGALQTLRNMENYDLSGLPTMNFEDQKFQMLDTMQHIISQRRDLKGQVLLVTYTQDDHIGDRILEEIERAKRPNPAQR